MWHGILTLSPECGVVHTIMQGFLYQCQACVHGFNCNVCPCSFVSSKMRYLSWFRALKNTVQFKAERFWPTYASFLLIVFFDVLAPVIKTPHTIHLEPAFTIITSSFFRCSVELRSVCRASLTAVFSFRQHVSGQICGH